MNSITIKITTIQVLESNSSSMNLIFDPPQLDYVPEAYQYAVASASNEIMFLAASEPF